MYKFYIALILLCLMLALVSTCGEQQTPLTPDTESSFKSAAYCGPGRTYSTEVWWDDDPTCDMIPEFCTNCSPCMHPDCDSVVACESDSCEVRVQAVAFEGPGPYPIEVAMWPRSPCGPGFKNRQIANSKSGTYQTYDVSWKWYVTKDEAYSFELNTSDDWLWAKLTVKIRDYPLIDERIINSDDDKIIFIDD